MTPKGIRLLVVGIGLFSAQTAFAQQYALTIHSEHVYFEPQAINTAGQVVGSGGHAHAFLWSDGVIEDLGQLPGTSQCIAMAINDSGQVVGSCSGYPSNQRLSSFLWTADTGMMALPIPDWSWAMGINNQGHIVGWRRDRTSGAPTHAFLYRDGVVEDLGPGSARGINDQDQVVGYGYDENGLSVARLWDDAGAHGLDHEGGVSVALAISDAGLIAGDRL